MVVDDASVDDTVEVVQTFSDRRIRYVRQSVNVGLTANWGAGIDLARGKFVSLLMDDDQYLPTFLARRRAALAEHGSAFFAFSGYQIVPEDGGASSIVAPDASSGQIMEGPSLLRVVLARQCFVGATLYRTSQLRDVWPDASRAQWVADYAANLRFALRRGSAVYVGGADFLMAHHAGQLSVERRQEVYALVARELRDRLAEVNPFWATQLMRDELASWLTVQGRFAAGRGERLAAIRCFLSAIAERPTASSAWKQLVRMALRI